MNQLINILSEIQVIGGNHKFKLCEEFIGDSVLESFFGKKLMVIPGKHLLNL